jgi:hypothetical protein
VGGLAKENNELPFPSSHIFGGAEARESIGNRNEGAIGVEYFGLATGVMFMCNTFDLFHDCFVK